MPRADFYLLADDTNQQAKLLLVCRLAEKAYTLKHQAYIHVASASEANQLNDLLWTYREDGFLPHNLYTANTTPTAPIQIGHNQDPQHHQDILFNLTTEIPGFFSKFQRIIEIIPAEAQQRTAARTRYKFYRDQGFQLASHPNIR